MEKLNNNNRIISVKDALLQFEEKINPLLLEASNEIRDGIIRDIDQAMETGEISKRKMRRRLYSVLKKEVLGTSEEKRNPSTEIEESLIFGEDFNTTQKEIQERFTNVDIKNVTGGMM